MKKSLSTTKGNYHRTTLKGKRAWLLVLTLLVFIGWMLPAVFFKVSSFVLYPIAEISNWINTSNETFPTYLRSKTKMAEEIESLQKKQSTEEGTRLTTKRLLEENIRLRNLLDIEKQEERVVAGVVSQPPNLVYDTLQIDKGSEQGVVVGAPVFSGIDSVIGVISKVAPDHAFVELFTSAGFETNAYIMGINVFSLMKGEGGGVAKVHLPQGIDLEKGQIVLLPGLSGGIYGEVVWVENLPTQPEQFGFVVPALPLNSLSFVSIGTKALKVKNLKEVENVIKDEHKKEMLLSGDILEYFKENSLSTTTATDTASSTAKNVKENSLSGAEN